VGRDVRNDSWSASSINMRTAQVSSIRIEQGFGIFWESDFQ
jgi:hypothetical protein